MVMAAATPPTGSDKDTLKVLIATSLQVALLSITNFVVEFSQLSTRRRLLAVFTWKVTFEIASSAVTDDSVIAALTSPEFVSAVASGVNATVDTSSITASPAPVSRTTKKDAPVLRAASAVVISSSGVGLVALFAVVAFWRYRHTLSVEPVEHVDDSENYPNAEVPAAGEELIKAPLATGKCTHHGVPVSSL